MELDKISRKMLCLLQDNNQLTSEEIGDKVGISASTVQRRMKKLRSANIIEKDISVISMKEVGNRFMVIMEIEMERENPNVLSELKTTMSKKEEVMQCYYVTGKSDFIVLMTFADMSSFERFCEDYILGNKNIKKFYTSVVVSRVKFGLKIPLGE